MKILILSCSMNPASRSAALAQRAHDYLVQTDAAVRLIDLRHSELPLCDGHSAYGREGVAELAEAVREADAVLMAVPVYNFYVNAAAKNLVELTGRAWTEKLVGFMCSAGGTGSYMSLMPLANSLMLDFRCLVVPRFVYTTSQGFDDEGQPLEAIRGRIEELCNEIVRIGTALKQAEPVVSMAAVRQSLE